LTDEEIHARALADPDAQPLTEERLARMKRVPRTVSMRRVMRLSREEFSARYRIPMDILTDWEEGRSEPDAVAVAYLRAIRRDPEGMKRLQAIVPAVT
jgi:putative transcriptional regulator